MLELLRSLEWCVPVEEDHAEYPGCPVCREKQPDGHAPDCRLDRAIRGLGSEPTVDEMAREMGLAKVAGLHSGVAWEDPETDALRLSRRWGPTWQDQGYWSYSEDPRRWPTDADAIRTLYREHKAKHADPPDEELERVLGRSVTKEEEPPTDPSALAAWLYARVVPGVWAEWADSDGDPYGGPVAQKHFRDGRLWLWAGRDSSHGRC